MKTAISLPDETFHRVDDAARRLGVSRSEFFARAAERWLDVLDEDGITEAIDRAIADAEPDHAFTDAAAAALVAKLGDKSRAGLRGAKHLANLTLTTDLATGLRQEIDFVHRYATTEPDATEGLIAFKEKRKPAFVR